MTRAELAPHLWGTARMLTYGLIAALGSILVYRALYTFVARDLAHLGGWGALAPYLPTADLSQCWVIAPGAILFGALVGHWVERFHVSALERVLVAALIGGGAGALNTPIAFAVHRFAGYAQGVPASANHYPLLEGMAWSFYYGMPIAVACGTLVGLALGVLAWPRRPRCGNGAPA